ncbi:MAG: endonuclease/exonuclease/phosphatase family protein, partial [Bacteroidetes bacterium]|nr:endonuclease/exonuclease/phosphatase family protein [Bacteroidota bacterium]
DEGDEEFRRLLAVTYLKEYIDSILPEEKVLVVGDLNDILTDDASNNVFLPFLDDANNYTFTDMDIAQGSSANYSFPTWPSHLDHILITNELFDIPQQTETIKVDEYMMNWNDYDNNVSDHRPVGWRLHNPNTSSISPMQNVMAQYSTTKEYIEIDFNTNLGGEFITVYNLEGKLIEKYKIPNTSDKFRFSIANFSAGAYFFSCNQVNLFGKFIVQ